MNAMSTLPKPPPSPPSPGAIGAWECQLASQALTWTDGVYDIFGLRRGSTIHRGDTLDLYEEQSRLEMNRLRSRAISTGQAFSLDCRLKAADGQRRWMRLLVGVEHRHGRPARIFGSKQDITAEKALWTDLIRSAEPRAIAPDTLLQGFEDALRRYNGRTDGRDHALVIYAIDDAADLLATYGAAACEGVMRSLEQRLARLFPDAIASGRLIGTSFGLLVPVSQERSRLVGMLESARRLLQRPVSHGPFVIDFTISAGAATGSAIGEAVSRQQLFAGAEAGLKAARLTGGEKLRLFDGPIAGARLDRPLSTV